MSSIVDDLRIEAEIPPRAQRPGAAVVVELRFINHGTRPRTLFVVGDESYRFGQSTFHLHVGSSAPLVQPPRRAGYVPTTADFRPLGPRSVLGLRQTLQLPRDLEPGKYEVEWVYENEVGSWPDSAAPASGNTSSGNTSSGGQPIPGIWRGRIVDAFTIEVAPPQILGPGGLAR